MAALLSGLFGAVAAGGALTALELRGPRLLERRAERTLAAHGLPGAEVRLQRRSFLRQLVRGRFAEIALSAETAVLGPLTAHSLSGRLSDVRAPIWPALRGRAAELTCGRLDAQLLIHYAELARLSRVPGLRLRYGGGPTEPLAASAAVSVPGLGSAVEVRGDALLTVTSDGGVLLRLRNITMPGIVNRPGRGLLPELAGLALSSISLGASAAAIPGAMLSAAAPGLELPLAMPALPFGLRIDSLQPTEHGLVARGHAEDAVLRADAGSVGGRRAAPAAGADTH